MAKNIVYSTQSRQALMAGVDKLANAVKATLGPKGRNVIIEKKFGSPLVTKDGVTVAKEIDLEDRQENIGAQMVKEVASKTSDIAGDGTTTATVLTQAMLREGLRAVGTGVNVMDLKKVKQTGTAGLKRNTRRSSSSKDIIARRNGKA